jgi:protein SCO1/2
MLFFGYTHCPDMCPTTLADMAAVVGQLGKDGERVQGLFVTVDPRRDTPDVLAQYVPAFHPSFLGLYADEGTTATLAKDFKIYYRAQPPDAQGNYTVDHMGGVFIFDPRGRLRLYVGAQRDVAGMAADVTLLLKGT